MNTPVTPEQFKVAKVQFAAVPDATVQVYLDMAGLWVDDSWPSKLYPHAVIAAACHLMTLDGLGTDAQSKSFAKGTASFQSVKTGEFSLARYQREAASSSFNGWLEQTACGNFFLQLLSMAKGGPRIAMGGIGACQSGYAKDVPGSGWPAWWGSR